MKNYKIILLTNLLLIFLFFFGCTELTNKKESDLKRLNINGEVSSIKESVKYVDLSDKINELRLTIYNSQGNISEYIDIRDSDGLKRIYKYDKNNNLTNISTYNSEGNKIFEIINKYENNVIIEILSYDQEGKLSRNVKNKYDKDGNVIEVNEHVIDWETVNKTTYSYDDDNNLIEFVSYNNDGSIMKKYIYKYNKKGLQIEARLVISPGLKEKQTFKYDENNNLIENIEFNENGTVRFKSIYHYDNNGNEIQRVNYHSDGSVMNKRTYNYEYDNKGNWIQRIEETTPHIKKEILYREIKYYQEGQYDNNTAEDNINNENNVSKKTEKTQASNPKYTCSEINGRFRKSSYNEIKELLGKPSSEYSNRHWYFLIYYTKVIDKFDNNKVKHLCIAVPKSINTMHTDNVISCLDKGEIWSVSTLRLRLP